MIKRAALYARFSTKGQKPKSIADQLRECRDLAVRLGATVVQEYTDEARSGVSMALRPGVLQLLADAADGRFDIVIAEDLSRLARSGGDTWDVYDDLDEAGVSIVTIAEPIVDETTVGFKGTMNQVDLANTRRRVKRGLKGVVESGRHVARPPYGYQRKLAYDAKGELVRGLLEVDPDRAAVVRRIHAEFLAGSSGQAIAMRLNAEGIPGPAGGGWHSNAILGDARRLQGVLRNPIYSGELVWNRATHRKSRRTGRAKARPNAPADYVRQAVADLRIVDAPTWEGVQARLAALSAKVSKAGNASAANQPRRLFSGLLKCGLCGSALATAGPDRRYRCRARTDRGPTACANSRTAPADALEAEVLAMLRRDLLHPDVVDAVVRKYHADQAARGSSQRQRLAALQRELGEVTRRAERLVDQVADGVLQGRSVQAKLAELEARQGAIEADLAKLSASAEVVALHPQAATRYRQLVEDLQARLTAGAQSRGAAERDKARALLHKVITQVRFMPGERRGQWTLEMDASLTALFQRAGVQAGPARATGN